MTDPAELAYCHHVELLASGLSPDSRAIVGHATKMLVDFASILVESTQETCGAEAEAVARMFLRQAGEMLSMGGEEPDAPAKPCAGECGVEAHRHLIAISPDGTRIYRERP